MDIQTKKLQFIQEFLRLKDENLIDKLNTLLKNENKVNSKSTLAPLSKEDFNEMINKAELDSENKKLIRAQELLIEIDLWS